MTAGTEQTTTAAKRRTTTRSRADATHNLSGQRLGPKGQNTRERILKAMLALLETDGDTPITLSAVAREAGVRMSNLYLYFPDLGDLLLAALHRVIEPDKTDYVQCVRALWPDAEIAERTESFVRAHFLFWRRHARLLQMRNAFADAHDRRLITYRNEISRPLIDLMARQMVVDPDEADQMFRDCATVLITGLERVSTVVINPDFARSVHMPDEVERLSYIDRLVRAEARVIEFTLVRMRAMARGD